MTSHVLELYKNSNVYVPDFLENIYSWQSYCFKEMGKGTENGAVISNPVAGAKDLAEM